MHKSMRKWFGHSLCVTSSDTDMVAMDTDAITMETAVKPETAVRMFCEHFNTGAYY